MATNPPSNMRISTTNIIIRLGFVMTCEVVLTPELSHAGPRTQANPRLPGKPEAFLGVGCSDLVRRSKFHHSKISGLLRRTRRDGRPCHCAESINSLCSLRSLRQKQNGKTATNA